MIFFRCLRTKGAQGGSPEALGPVPARGGSRVPTALGGPSHCDGRGPPSPPHGPLCAALVRRGTGSWGKYPRLSVLTTLLAAAQNSNRKAHERMLKRRRREPRWPRGAGMFRGFLPPAIHPAEFHTRKQLHYINNRKTPLMCHTEKQLLVTHQGNRGGEKTLHLFLL